jgi:hypothetical protein
VSVEGLIKQKKRSAGKVRFASWTIRSARGAAYQVRSIDTVHNGQS